MIISGKFYYKYKWKKYRKTDKILIVLEIQINYLFLKMRWQNKNLKNTHKNFIYENFINHYFIKTMKYT